MFVGHKIPSAVTLSYYNGLAREITLVTFCLNAEWDAAVALSVWWLTNCVDDRQILALSTLWLWGSPTLRLKGSLGSSIAGKSVGAWSYTFCFPYTFIACVWINLPSYLNIYKRLCEDVTVVIDSFPSGCKKKKYDSWHFSLCNRPS